MTGPLYSTFLREIAARFVAAGLIGEDRSDEAAERLAVSLASALCECHGAMDDRTDREKVDPSEHDDECPYVEVVATVEDHAAGRESE
jgi:hypothetical protein